MSDPDSGVVIPRHATDDRVVEERHPRRAAVGNGRHEQPQQPARLAWGPEGALYVAEAGTAAISGPCATVPRGQNCYTGTGSITRLWKGTQERVATGLPSHVLVTAMGPGDVTGPHDISFQGKGNAYVTIGWGGPPAARAQLGALGGLFEATIRVSPNGGFDVVADIAASSRRTIRRADRSTPTPTAFSLRRGGSS